MGHHQGANPMRLNQRDGVSKEGEKGLGPHLALTLGFACTFNQRWFTSTVS